MEAYGTGKSGIVHGLPPYAVEDFTCLTCGETKMLIERNHRPIVRKEQREINGNFYLEDVVYYNCIHCAKKGVTNDK